MVQCYFPFSRRGVIMTKLTSKQRKSLPDQEFALPDERKYPLDTKNRARNAKARASEEYHKGNLTKEQEETVDRKADQVLKEK